MDDDAPLDPAEFFADDARAASAPLVGADVPAGHRSGYVALVGAPNVGKSTLLNRLLGTKLSIVSPRPSTTRNRVLGIQSSDGDDGRPPFQIVWLDTPGVVRPKYRLHEHMMRDVDRSLGDADVTVLLADATEPHLRAEAREAAARAARSSAPVLLALNKVDALPGQAEALPLVAAYTDAFRAGDGAPRDFDAVVPVSALTGAGVSTLLALVLERVPLGPPYYPPDQLSEHPERFFLGEIVREAIFHQYRDEVPYATQVLVVRVQERPGEKLRVTADIVVERDSQKAILIGKGGAALKRLGRAAREEIEDFLGRPVYLELFVKTRTDWRDRDGYLREYGFG